MLLRCPRLRDYGSRPTLKPILTGTAEKSLTERKVGFYATTTTKTATPDYYSIGQRTDIVFVFARLALSATLVFFFLLFLGRVKLFVRGQRGYRVIAKEPSGHGRSGPDVGTAMKWTRTQTIWPRYLKASKFLRTAIMVGHSTVVAKSARYLGSHGSKRVAKGR